MDNIQQTIDAVGKVYDKTTYFDTYGGSMFFCIALLVFLAMFHMYQRMMLKAEPIRRNWAANRCSPTVIPFAGNIMRPTNMSWIKFTGLNFNICLNNILTQITGYFVQPVQSILSPILKLWKSMLGVLQEIRTMIAYIRTMLANIFKDFFTRLENIIPPMQRMIAALKDMLAKIQGIFKSGVYMLVGVYYAMMSFFGLLLTLVIIILMVLSVLILLLWFWPWWWGIAAMLTVTYMSIMIPLLIMVVFFKDYFGVQSPLSVPMAPMKPSCFGGATPIALANGTTMPIRSIRPGTELADGGVITATMRLAAQGESVYLLHGVSVTGEHYVKHGDVWTQVKNHPDAESRPDYYDPYVYCLNTTTKHITVGDIVFSDWDDLHEPGMVAAFLAHYPDPVNPADPLEPSCGTDVHRRLDGGLTDDTLVAFPDGVSKTIDSVVVGDTLANGTCVRGVVSVLGTDLCQTACQVDLDLGRNSSAIVCGAPHNVFVDGESGDPRSTLFLPPVKKSPIPHHRELFHLITDTETFSLSNGIVMRDYTASIDFFDLFKEK